ncbi:MAG: CapA family protein [Clostridia bacterium]|nr:CapA family protein [Clostridia bacterium]
MAKKRKFKKRVGAKILTCFYSFVLIATIALLGFVAFSLTKAEKETVKEPSVSSASSEIKFKETTATVLSTGDIMVHSPQLNGAFIPSSGVYDFSAFFKETAPFFKKADLSIGNLEVTFGGNEGREYTGYPMFNTPDSLADAIKASGLNLLLTSNNHSYDTGLSGLKRTVQVLKQKGIDYTGTREFETEPVYKIKKINNINIGIINYTYETSPANPTAGRKYLNGSVISAEANNLINTFSYNNINAFYNDIQINLGKMKDEGAEFLVVYIHWGNEYQTSPNTHQKSIAQNLCNMGVDIIIGSHPHVIQPVELITSEDSSHTAICLYSTGNAVSNQRQEVMTSCPTGHTEDGMLFEFTLKKTKDGVILSSLDLIPTWVNKYLKDGRYQYTIYPLENPNDLGKYSFNATELSKAQKSYERTKEIVAIGLTECQQSVGCDITFN